MRHILLVFSILTALLICGCASTESKKEPQQREDEDPALAKARAEWKKFVEKKKEEERDRHDLYSLQNDKDRVFPWREGRRSERLHERQDKSIFSLW